MYSLSTCWNSGRHTDGRAMLREIRDLGFEYAELSHGIRISLLPGILDAVQAGEIKISTLHNFCPLPMGVHYPAPNLFKFSSEDRRERESAWKHSLKTIETAARVGAKLVVLHSGQVDIKDYNDKLEEMVARGERETPRYRKLVEEMDSKRERRKERALELSLDMIRNLADAAAGEGLLLGIENREAVEEIPFDHDLPIFLAQIKENLGLIQHALHLEGMAERLGGLHVHDVIADEEGQHDHCPPGFGMIDYAALRPWVRPEHIKVLELSPGTESEHVRRGFQHIKSVWGEE
jgi:sugar phosphate isomerase/epimerase